MEVNECNVSSKGAIPKRVRRDSVIHRHASTYLDETMDLDLERYMKNMGRISRRSLHDEVIRSVIALKPNLTVPDNSTIRRHSFNESDVGKRTSPSRTAPNRRSSRVKRSASMVSSRSRRGSKYYSGDRRPSHTSSSKNGDVTLMVGKNNTSPEDYRKELKRRRVVWLVIGMFFFILTVSVLIVLITLTHRVDNSVYRRNSKSNCT